jgi:hypothetical protein
MRTQRFLALVAALASALAAFALPSASHAGTSDVFSASLARVTSVESGRIKVEVLGGASSSGEGSRFATLNKTVELTPKPGTKFPTVAVGDGVVYSGWTDIQTGTKKVPVVHCVNGVCTTMIVTKTVTTYTGYASVTNVGKLACAKPSQGINVPIPLNPDYSVHIKVCRTTTLANQRLAFGGFPRTAVRDVKLTVTFTSGSTVVLTPTLPPAHMPPSGWAAYTGLPAGTASTAIRSMVLTFDVVDDGKPPMSVTVGALNTPVY